MRNGRLRSLPLFFGRWTATRDLPPVAARTFRERWKELEPRWPRAPSFSAASGRRSRRRRAPLRGADRGRARRDRAEAAEAVRRQMAERWPEALERFRQEFERVAGVFHRVQTVAEVPGVVLAIARDEVGERQW